MIEVRIVIDNNKVYLNDITLPRTSELTIDPSV